MNENIRLFDSDSGTIISIGPNLRLVEVDDNENVMGTVANFKNSSHNSDFFFSGTISFQDARQ